MTVPVAVIVPWRPADPHRNRARRWVDAQYAHHHPEWPVVSGCSPDGPFNRCAAILDGAAKVDADRYVITDGDCWADPALAVSLLDDHPWVIPHRFIWRLSAAATELVLAGEQLGPHLELDRAHTRDAHPYLGYQAGTMLTIHRDVLADVPPDVRFAGWGHEEQAWSAALRMLAGAPYRMAQDLWHLWHPPQPRRARDLGSEANEALWHRYRDAETSSVMRALVDETRGVQGG